MAEKVIDGMSLVFLLAADHGGRGYVDLHQAACATNLTLDGMMFLACDRARVDHSTISRRRTTSGFWTC